MISPASTPYWNAELETKPWMEVERWQALRLSSLLPPLRQRSALYARLHVAVPDAPRLRDLADLAALPFTFKDDVRAAQAAATDSQPFGANQAVPTADIVQAISSSGTTGAPLYYALTRHDAEVFADAIANVWFTAGIRADDVVAHLVGLPMVAGGLPYADGFRRVGATLCWLGGFPADRIVREMRRLRVTAMLATTSFALHLGEQHRAEGVGDLVASKLAKVLGGGEPGLGEPAIRARIEAGLGLSHLRDTMGLGDVLSSMWGECEAQDGMHFNAQRYVAVELIDPASGEGVPWREGATGELVYSAFDREATPLVRYRSRDHAQVVGMGCACGRSSPRIRCIGRTDDMLIYKGMNVFPTAVRDLVASRFAGRVGPVLRLWKRHAEQVRFDNPIEVDIERMPASHIVGASAGDAFGADPAAGGRPGEHALQRAIEAAVREQLQVRIAVAFVEAGAAAPNAYKNPLLAVREPASPEDTPPS